MSDPKNQDASVPGRVAEMILADLSGKLNLDTSLSSKVVNGFREYRFKAVSETSFKAVSEEDILKVCEGLQRQMPNRDHYNALENLREQLRAGKTTNEASNLPRATALDLGQNDIGDAGARALANSPNLKNLTKLDLGDSEMRGPSGGSDATKPQPPAKRRDQALGSSDGIDQNPIKPGRNKWER
jgi:hypothetical protein